jgi:HAD superfamily hydrolase (TIGR01490 family)
MRKPTDLGGAPTDYGMARPRHPPLKRQAAFFDVDETLIALKSMFAFLRFYLFERGESEATYQRLTDQLHTAADRGVSREDINRHYYRLYAGESVEHLAAVGRRWFQSTIDEHSWITATRAAYQQHQNDGTACGLISGSFFACIDPIAEHLAAAWTDTTRLVIRSGQLTGDVYYPMIAQQKATAINSRIRTQQLDAAQCSAYGDHASDLPMLSSVGHPVVVGDNAVLTRHAAEQGWPHLPATCATA